MTEVIEKRKGETDRRGIGGPHPGHRPGKGMGPSFSGLKVLVVGLGVSGLWTARWLLDEGARVTVSEIRDLAELDGALVGELRGRDVTLETGGHEVRTFLESDAVIISPGVPHTHPALVAAREKGIPVWGEVELASRLIESPLIAVTGSNGKSTVTAFLGCILEKAGRRVFVGGNIGTPLMAYVAEGKGADIVVAEVSSFQLDTIERFSPRVALILNLSPDHLDRYPDYEAYVQSKLRIFENQGPGRHLILNDDDERLRGLSPEQGMAVWRYGMEKLPGRRAYLEGPRIRSDAVSSKDAVISLERFRLPGRHNRQNALAAVLGGLALGIEPEAIQRGVDAFEGLPNRLERIGEWKGVTFYNDSKATNVDAAVTAVRSFDRPVILIAGGRHKGASYGPLVEACRGKVRRGVFLGEARDLLAGSFHGVVPYCTVQSMDEAVRLAFTKAQAGDVVLLAPACSSFDMFSDYAHRGGVFRDAVARLIHG